MDRHDREKGRPVEARKLSRLCRCILTIPVDGSEGFETAADLVNTGLLDVARSATSIILVSLSKGSAEVSERNIVVEILLPAPSRRRRLVIVILGRSGGGAAAP